MLVELRVLITKTEERNNRKMQLCELMAVLISLIVVIISGCIYVSEHQVVHFKYIQFLLVSYNSMKLKKETPKAAGDYRIQGSLNGIGLDQRRSCHPSNLEG